MIMVIIKDDVNWKDVKVNNYVFIKWINITVFRVEVREYVNIKFRETDVTPVVEPVDANIIVKKEHVEIVAEIRDVKNTTSGNHNV